jgi:hypothetical protein
MEKAEAIKGECRLRSIEGGRKPPLAEDLHRFRQRDTLAPTVVDVYMMDASQSEHREVLWAAFGTRANVS